MGRVLAQVEQTSTPVPAQACVHVDDEELQIVQDERYGHYLSVERCRARVGDGSRDPKDKDVLVHVAAYPNPIDCDRKDPSDPEKQNTRQRFLLDFPLFWFPALVCVIRGTLS